MVLAVGKCAAMHVLKIGSSWTSWTMYSVSSGNTIAKTSLVVVVANVTTLVVTPRPATRPQSLRVTTPTDGQESALLQTEQSVLEGSDMVSIQDVFIKNAWLL